MGDFKKEQGKSRFGKFIEKAGGIFPDILKAGVKLSTGNVMGALGDVAGMLSANKDSNDNPEARSRAQELLNEFELQREEFALESFRIEAQDVQNARDNETARDLSDQTGWLTKNVHEVIAIGIIGLWLVTWFYKPEIDYSDITGVVTLILGYLYGRTKPQK